MGDRQGRLSAVNLCPFVGVDLNLWPTVYIAVIVLTRTENESNRKSFDVVSLGRRFALRSSRDEK